MDASRYKRVKGINQILTSTVLPYVAVINENKDTEAIHCKFSLLNFTKLWFKISAIVDTLIIIWDFYNHDQLDQRKVIKKAFDN